MNEIAPTTTDCQAGMRIDLSHYSSLFDDDEISEADKQALLGALWSIIISFVQLGWGVHPAQQAKTSRAADGISCGQTLESSRENISESTAVVEFEDHHLIEHFDSAAGQPPQKEKES